MTSRAVWMERGLISTKAKCLEGELGKFFFVGCGIHDHTICACPNAAEGLT